MSKKSKLRLDFWKKSFWQEPHILGAGFHAAADVFLPQKAQKVLGLVEDYVDDGKLNGSAKQGSKSYWIVRAIFTVLFFGVIVALLLSKVISWAQALDALERFLVPIVTGAGLFIPFMLAAQQGEKYRVLSPKQVWEKEHPGEEYREPRIYPESEERTYYEFRTTNENGNEKICRDYFGDILTASGHVDYPFGANDDYRNLKYIDEHSERFELIEEETQPTNNGE
jgi:hypothetical protein